MFKNREFRVRMVKTPKEQTENDAPEMEESIHVDPEQIAEIAKDFVKHTAIVVGAVIGATTILSAACEIAVKRTKSKDHE